MSATQKPCRLALWQDGPWSVARLHLRRSAEAGQLVGVGDDVNSAYLVAVGVEVEGYEHVRGAARQQQRCGFAVDAAVADVEIGDGVPEGIAGDEAGDLVPALYWMGARRARLAAAIGPHGHVRRQDLHEGIE